MVFRGVIMGLLEKWGNIKIAVIVPSVLFGLLHVLNGKLNLLSFIQLLIAGTVVSILFHGYPFNTSQIIYKAVQINRPQKPENIV